MTILVFRFSKILILSHVNITFYFGDYYVLKAINEKYLDPSRLLAIIGKEMLIQSTGKYSSFVC